MEINAIIFIACAQNKRTGENMCALIALLNTCLTFFLLTIDVVNDIHCIRIAKVQSSQVKYPETTHAMIEL